MLWEYYDKRYTPEWVRGRDEKGRGEVRGKLANIDAILEPRPGHIIYFEDPFGKTRYERMDDLKARINFIISSVRNKEDVYVVITSRKDVFEEFEKESYSVEEIKKFEEELNILKPSYSYEKRKEILEIDFVKQEYENLKDRNFEDFEKILEEEYRVKVRKWEGKIILEFSHPSYSNALPHILDHAGCRNIFCKVLTEFSELSEKEEAAEDVAEVIAKNFDRLPKDVRNKLLLKLSENEKTAGNVAWAIAENFDKLPKDVRNLLFKLSENEKTAGNVAWAIAENFDKLPKDVRNLLFKLSENEEAAGDVARAIAYKFDKFPEEVRNKLLFKLSEKEEAAEDVAWAIAWNFDRLPEDVRNLLDRLQKPLQRVIEGLAIKSENDGLKRESLRLIFNARTKLNSDFVLKMLNKLSNDENKTIRVEAKVLRKAIFGKR